MAISTVQTCGNGVAASGSGTKTVSTSFASDNAAGNTILVWIFGVCNGPGVYPSAHSVSDTASNIYTQLFASLPGGNQNGGWIGLYSATILAAGPNTVTFSATISGGSPYDLTLSLIAGEYSGMSSPTLQGYALANIAGSSGNDPTVLTITDSFGASVSVTFKTGGAPGSNGLGSIDTSAGLVDLLSGGVNYLVGACQSQFATVLVPTTSPSGYQTFGLEKTVSSERLLRRVPVGR